MKSKTIILSKLDDKNSNSRGIVTFYEEDDLLKCKLRLYSTPTLTRDCKIGVYHKEEVYSANFIYRNGMYESSFVGDFDLDKDFYTAIVDTAHENQVILAGGTYAGYYFDDENIFNPSTKQDTKAINKDNIEQQNNDNCLEQNCDKCLHCKYKEYFYNQDNKSSTNTDDQENITSSLDILNNKDLKQQENNIDAHSILQSIIPQFDYIFENYAQDTELNNLLENSKFVKINEDNDYYSIGVIYDNNTPKYICYAKRSNYNLSAPNELGDHYQWLPLDADDPLSEGYYIVYQDAKDLKILEL